MTEAVTKITIPLSNRSLRYLREAINALLDAGVPGSATVENAPDVICITISNQNMADKVTAALAKVGQ